MDKIKKKYRIMIFFVVAIIFVCCVGASIMIDQYPFFKGVLLTLGGVGIVAVAVGIIAGIIGLGIWAFDDEF